MKNGNIDLRRVREGTYRLTVYAKGEVGSAVISRSVLLNSPNPCRSLGVFGEFIQDNVVIRAGRVTTIRNAWKQDSAGRELWRIGIPDKTSGE